MAGSADQLVDAMVRLEAALRPPILALKIPDE
jgi:hypothetical protein